MSKELTPLEALKSIEDFIYLISLDRNIKHADCPDVIVWVKRNFNFDIIEKELKALEIIKEKQVNVEIFIEVIKQFEVKPSPYAKVSLWTITGREEDKKETFETELEFYNRTCLYGSNHLSQEEYDLLKEVLK